MTTAPRDTTTRIVHPEVRELGDFRTLTTPIHHASTVVFPSVADMRSRIWERDDIFTYGLQGTPTTRVLEQQLAMIEGAEHCLLAPSGLSAITIVDLALLKSGEQVLMPENVYHPSREFATRVLGGFGVQAAFYDPLDPSDLESRIGPSTRLVWLESPGSVTMEVPDLVAMLAIVARINAGRSPESHITTAIDNTWSAGLGLNPFEFGIDISMQALTKYQSGGSDVLMGALLTRDRALHTTLKFTHMRLGLGVGPDDAYLVLRGLKSMAARFALHDASARQRADWCADQPEVAAVLHPALPSCPGHAFWKRDFSSAGGLFSIVLDARFSEAQVEAFVESLALFPLGYSWGGASSLSMVYAAGRTSTLGAAAGMLVRLNVGLEAVADLQADLEQAFSRLRAAPTAASSP
ncbi:cystathionine beta-lyase [soil metagenome]